MDLGDYDVQCMLINCDVYHLVRGVDNSGGGVLCRVGAGRYTGNHSVVL